MEEIITYNIQCYEHHVRNCRGASCDSDHYLITTKFQRQINNTKANYEGKTAATN